MTKAQMWTTAKPHLKQVELGFLYQIMSAVGESDDPDEILSVAVSALKENTGAPIVAIFRLADNDESMLELVKAVDERGPSRYLSKVISGKLEMDWGFLPQMIADCLPRCFDFSTKTEHPTVRYLMENCDIKGALCAPMALNGIMRGFYALLYEQPPTLDEQEVLFFILLGGALATVLKYSDLLERFDATVEMVSAINCSNEIRMHAHALQQSLDHIMRISDAPFESMHQIVDRPRDVLQPFANLTQGEITTMALVSSGCSNDEIAAQLHISEGTVKKRIGTIMSKLNLKNRTQLGVYYARFAR